MKSRARLFLITCLFGFMIGCKNDDDSLSQEQENFNLERMFAEIDEIAKSITCDNSENWSFTAIGSKACGGPTEYLAYPLNIDTESFLKKVEEHKKAMDDFNKRWGVISDCSTPVTPISVNCQNGQPVFEY